MSGVGEAALSAPRKGMESVLDEGEERQGGEASFAHLREGRARAAIRGAFWAGLNSFAPAVLAAGMFTVTSRSAPR